ncbi:MAG: YIP1 family protein [Rhodobacteraceae bacterium]|nr:YIP1 family protein [Paracoccaceae bacterium]
MNGLAGIFGQLAVETLRQPRMAARRLIGWDLPPGARFTALVLAAVLSILSFLASFAISPPAEIPAIFALMTNPWLGVPLQVASQLVLALIMTLSGRAQGAKGRFADAVVLVAMVQVLLAAGQVLQTLIYLALPILTLPLALGVLALFVWIITSFTAELHGLPGFLKPFGALLLTFLLIMVVLAVIMSVLGFAPSVSGAGHV